MKKLGLAVLDFDLQRVWQHKVEEFWMDHRFDCTKVGHKYQRVFASHICIALVIRSVFIDRVGV